MHWKKATQNMKASICPAYRGVDGGVPSTSSELSPLSADLIIIDDTMAARSGVAFVAGGCGLLLYIIEGYDFSDAAVLTSDGCHVSIGRWRSGLT